MVIGKGSAFEEGPPLKFQKPQTIPKQKSTHTPTNCAEVYYSWFVVYQVTQKFSKLKVDLCCKGSKTLY